LWSFFIKKIRIPITNSIPLQSYGISPLTLPASFFWGGHPAATILFNYYFLTMALETLFEKLQLSNEKNILIQGLPSSIEKQFIKISYAKSVTPLLKIKKVEFALLFAVSKKQLTDVLTDVTPALHSNVKLWVAYPKPTSKIASDLIRECNWCCIDELGFEAIHQVTLDNVWSAIRLQRAEEVMPKRNSLSALQVRMKEQALMEVEVD
jgi:hypothetical protein